MGIQENINRSIGSLSRLLGIMKVKKSIEQIKPDKLLSGDTKEQLKNFSKAGKKLRSGKATISKEDMDKLNQYVTDLEEKALNTPLPEYSPVPNDTKAPDDFDIDSLESSTPNRMNPFMAAERAQTAIDDKQLEYSFSKPKATILPFEPKDSKKATILPFEPKESKKATILPFEPKD